MRLRPLMMMWTASLCVALAWSSAAWGVSVQVSITATAHEFGGAQPDVFGLAFQCDCNVRILQAIYDLSSSAGHLFFNTQPEGQGAWGFHVLPDSFFPATVSSNVGATAIFTDGSPLLLINFSDFGPNETLLFDIDVDGPDCTTFDAAKFAGTYLGILFDPGPAFPGAQPYGLSFRFANMGGLAILEQQGGTLNIPEPATVLLVASGGLVLFARLRRRRMGRSMTD